MPDPAVIDHPEIEDVTPEMWEAVDQIIEEYKDRAGALIPVLRRSQDTVGYLPRDLLEYIARGINVSRADVFGVATFYSLFSLTPKGRHTIKVCEGTACYVRGIKEIVNLIKSNYDVPVGGTTEDRRFSLESVRCLGACGLAPVIVVDQDTHGIVTPDKIENILERYE
ncbi:MAG: NADH-quinone oxidoreductase subunit NuoE [Desulfatibacillaceae bacterium]